MAAGVRANQVPVPAPAPATAAPRSPAGGPALTTERGTPAPGLLGLVALPTTGDPSLASGAAPAPAWGARAPAALNLVAPPPALAPPGPQKPPRSSVNSTVVDATQAGIPAAASQLQSQNTNAVPHGPGMAAPAPAPATPDGADALTASFTAGAQPPSSCSVLVRLRQVLREVARHASGLRATRVGAVNRLQGHDAGRIPMLPSAPAGAMAPAFGAAGARASGTAAPAWGIAGLSTLPAGASMELGFRVAVMELLLMGQDLFPFDAWKQALVVWALADAIPAVSHSLDISSIWVRHPRIGR